jgi:haloacid dehalogenase-like hydrolase
MTGPAGTAPPLFVDLDGTLVRGDTTALCVVALRDRPLTLLRALSALRRGRAALKQALAAAAPPDPARLAYNVEFLALLRREAASGRRLVLATGADRRIAEAVAAHLGFFSAVLASDGRVNLTATAKLAAIRGMTGDGPFAYAGNERKDLAVWREAAGAILVNAPDRVFRAAARMTTIEARLS